RREVPGGLGAVQAHAEPAAGQHPQRRPRGRAQAAQQPRAGHGRVRPDLSREPDVGGAGPQQRAGPSLVRPGGRPRRALRLSWAAGPSSLVPGELRAKEAVMAEPLLSEARGEQEPPLLEETIGANLERTVQRYADR